MLGMLCFKSSWKSIRGPSDGLPVFLRSVEISPVLSTLGSWAVGRGAGREESATGVSTWSKSIRLSFPDCVGAAACLFSTDLEGMAFAPCAPWPGRMG